MNEKNLNYYGILLVGLMFGKELYNSSLSGIVVIDFFMLVMIICAGIFLVKVSIKDYNEYLKNKKIENFSLTLTAVFVIMSNAAFYFYLTN